MKRVWPLIIRRHEHGFSVVEVLLAVTIFGFLATGIIGALVYGRISTANGGDQTRAVFLAEEGLEASRNIGNAAFANLVDSATAVGDTNVETGNDSNPNSTNAYKVTTGSTTSGTVTSASVYVRTVDAVNPHVQMAIYSDSSGSPGTLLGTSAIQSVTTTGWQVFPITGVTVTASTNYWIGLSEDGNTVFASLIGGGVANGAKYDLTSAYPAPSTFSVSDTQPDKISFYMNVGSTYGMAKLSNVWAFSGVSDTTDIYTRKVTVVTSSTNRKQITSTVTWPEPRGMGQVSLTTQLSNWRAATKTWTNAITAGTATPAGTLTGVKVATAGNYAYLILNSTTNNFIVIDISNPAAPSIVSTTSTGATPTNIAVSGNFVYITSSTATSGLKIYNVTTPTAPTLATTVAFTGAAACNGVFVNGNYAYVVRTLSATAGSNEFNVVNVTTPASATIVGGYNNDANTMNEVWAAGNYAYVAQTGTATVAEMAVINVTTPTAPSLAGSYNPAGTNTGKTISGIGNTVFLGYGTTLNSVNVTTPASPVSLGSFTSVGTVQGISVDPTSMLAFLGTTSTTGEFQVVNVAAPAAMTLVKTLDLSGTSALNGVAYNTSLDLAVGASAATTLELRVLTKN